jgi:Mor family transcriptional regulator
MEHDPKNVDPIDVEINQDDLPPDLQQIADLLGMDAVLRLCAQFGGEQIYIHKLAELAKASRDRDIVAAFNGRNHLELARKYNLTSKRIRQILAAAGPSKRIDKKDQKQLSLF